MELATTLQSFSIFEYLPGMLLLDVWASGIPVLFGGPRRVFSCGAHSEDMSDPNTKVRLGSCDMPELMIVTPTEKLHIISENRIDLRDPATLGCVLHLLRRYKPFANPVRVGELWRVGGVTPDTYSSEAEALLGALHREEARIERVVMVRSKLGETN